MAFQIDSANNQAPFKMYVLTKAAYDFLASGGSIDGHVIDDDALYLTTDAKEAHLPLSGGIMLGEISVGQGDGFGIQLGTNGRINATNSTGSKNCTVSGISGSDYLSGHSTFNYMIRGSATRPTYNGADLALLTDIAGSGIFLPLAGGTLTGNLNLLTANNDRYITWNYSDSTKGASWRIGHQGSGSSDSNYFVIQTTGSSTGTSETWSNAVQIGMDTKDVTLTGSLTLGSPLAIASGGTGQTTAKNAANAFMNALGTGDSTPVDADYYISQYVGGGTTTTTYHRRPMSALWSYISGKVSASYPTKTGSGASGTWGISISGNAATATSAKKATQDGNGATISSTYLKLAGGTMTGVISKAGGSSSWINGRDRALVRLSSYSAYSALASMKTTNGAWEMGVYTGDNMYFTYTPDAKYNASDNSGYNQIQLLSDASLNVNGNYRCSGTVGGIVGMTSTAPNGKMLWAY